MNWLSIEWLKGILSPEEFKLVTMVCGGTLFMTLFLIKANTVITNQVAIRAENKVISIELVELRERVAYISGQSAGKNEALSSAANRLIKLESFHMRIPNDDVIGGE